MITLPDYTDLEPIREAARKLTKHLTDKGGKAKGLWIYRTLDGKPIYARYRVDISDGKQIRPFKPVGNDWTTATAGEPDFKALGFTNGKPLFNLDLLPLFPNEVVYVVEGEKCAKLLTDLGILAITSGGAQSAITSDWQALTGRKVVIWADNDTAGKEYAAAVSSKLTGIAASVELVDIDALGLSEKDDCVEWAVLFEQSHGRKPNYDDVLSLPKIMSDVQVINQDDATAWDSPTPLPDSLLPVHKFDYALLPEALRPWIEDIAKRMQCPSDFPAIGAIVALSSLIGARVLIQPKQRDPWQVVPNLWGMAVGRPSVKKSPAINEALKPLHKLEANEREGWQVAHDAWEIEKRIKDLTESVNQKDAAKAAGKDNDKARRLLAPVDIEPEPIIRKYVVNDSSVEALGVILKDHPYGLLTYRDELYGLLTSLDKQGQEGSRGFYLTGYNGDSGYTFERIGRGTVFLPRVCIAMLGCIQPSRLDSYVRDAVQGGGGDDGLTQRFGLMVYPDIDASYTYTDRYADSQAKQNAYAVFDRLNALPVHDEPLVMRFDDEAQALFKEWLTELETEIRGDSLHPALVSHLAKYGKLIPALALIFSLIDKPDSPTVGKDEMLKAAAWGEYLRSHAERIYAAAAMPEMDGAKSLLSKIKSGKLDDGFTARQVIQKNWAGINNTEVVKKACALLEDYGWLKLEINPAGKQGGRPSERYVINPQAITKGAK